MTDYLKGKGYSELATDQEKKIATQLLLAVPESDLQRLARDESAPMLVRMLAKEILTCDDPHKLFGYL